MVLIHASLRLCSGQVRAVFLLVYADWGEHLVSWGCPPLKRGLYRIDDHGETHALPYSRASDRGDRGFYVFVDLFWVLGYSLGGVMITFDRRHGFVPH